MEKRMPTEYQHKLHKLYHRKHCGYERLTGYATPLGHQLPETFRTRYVTSRITRSVEKDAFKDGR